MTDGCILSNNKAQTYQAISPKLKDKMIYPKNSYEKKGTTIKNSRKKTRAPPTENHLQNKTC